MMLTSALLHLLFFGQSISFSYRYNMPSSSSRSCPCCSFESLNEHLFLPASVAAATSHHGETQQQQQQQDEEKEETELVDELPNVATVWKRIQEAVKDVDDERKRPRLRILLVDTHGHAHLEEEDSSDYTSPIYRLPDDTDATKSDDKFLSVSCSVSPDDWKACMEHVSQSNYRMAALGVHPWYLANLPTDWLENLETVLQQHAGIMVGEIGLCKVARFIRTYEQGKAAALALQRNVFTQQLDLAAAYQRPVTVHCVHQQQILLDSLKERSSRQQLPPTIALHSFTGTAHHIDQLLKWEASLNARRRKKKNCDRTASAGNDEAQAKEEESSSPLLYFGFSHTVNYAMCSSVKSRKQGRDAIRRVPANRLLAESDVHCTRDDMGGTALAVAYMAWALEEPVATVAQRTTANALRFLQSIEKATTERRESKVQQEKE